MSDNFIYFVNDTSANSTILHVVTAKRVGHIGIGFGSESSFSSATLFISANWPDDIVMLRSHLGDRRWVPPFIVENSTLSMLDDYWHFEVSVNYTDVSQRYVYFCRGSEDPWTSKLAIPHSSYGVRESPVYNQTFARSPEICDTSYLGRPGRFFAYYTWLAVIVFIFYTFTFLLSVYYRNVNPLRSRGIGPVIISSMFSFNLVMEWFINQFDYEQKAPVDCFATDYVMYPTFETMLIIPSLYLLRYIFIMNVNIERNKIGMGGYSEVEISRKLSLPMRILNKLTSPVFLVVVPVICYLSFIVMVTIVYSIGGFQCDSIAKDVIRYTHFAITFSLSILLMLLQFYDIIAQRRVLLRCDWRYFLLTEDHYMFRMEFVSLPLAIVIGVSWLIAGFFSGTIRMILCEGMFLILFWMCVGFTLSRTIFLDIFSRCYPSKSGQVAQNQMETVLQDSHLSTMFRKFAENEWSQENFLFREASVEYRNSHPDRRLGYAKYIIRTFLDPSDAIFPVNTTKQALDIINEQILEKKLEPNLFESIEKDVMVNLSDTFSRFIVSYEYRAFKSRTKLMEHVTSFTIKNVL